MRRGGKSGIMAVINVNCSNACYNVSLLFQRYHCGYDVLAANLTPYHLKGSFCVQAMAVNTDLVY